MSLDPPKTPDWERLNAYVDGELPLDEAADIERCARADTTVAAEIEALRRMKALSAAAFEGTLGGAPPMPFIPDRTLDRDRPSLAPRRTAGRSRLIVQIAASLVVAAGLSVWMLADDPGNGRLSAETFDAAGLQAYAEWKANSTAAKGPHVKVGALRRLDVPDLSPLMLEAATARPLTHEPGGRDASMYVGYSGPNGCQLGLIFGPAPDGYPGAMAKSRSGAIMIARWMVAGTAYIAISEGMDGQRFDAAAFFLERQTRGVTEAHLTISEADARTPCV